MAGQTRLVTCIQLLVKSVLATAKAIDGNYKSIELRWQAGKARSLQRRRTSEARKMARLANLNGGGIEELNITRAPAF